MDAVDDPAVNFGVVLAGEELAADVAAVPGGLRGCVQG